MLSTSAFTPRPNSWRNFYGNHPAKAVASCDLRSIRALTEFGENINISSKFENLAREKDLLFLSIGPNNKTQVFHQAQLIGGSRLNPETTFAALSGFGPVATPIELQPASLLTEIDIQVPCWLNLSNSLESVDEFKAVAARTLQEQEDDVVIVGAEDDNEAENATETPRNFDRFQCKNVIALPLALAPQAIESVNRDPASMAVAVWSQMSTLDDKIEQGSMQQEFTLEFRHLIKFLWAAHVKKVPPLQISNSEEPAVIDWSYRTHSEILLPPSLNANLDNGKPTAPLDPTSPRAANSVLDKVAFSLSSLTDTLIAQKTAKEVDREDSKPGFKKFDKHIQRMILHASAIEPFTDPATEPTTEFSNFLKQKQLGSATTYLQCHFRGQRLNFAPSKALCTALYSGHLLWDQSEAPINFSIFFHGKVSALSSSSLQAQALYIKATLGNGITDTEINKILKQDRCTPTTLHDYLEQVQNFYASCSLIFGESAKLTRAVKTWIIHAMRNRQVYEALQARDLTFLSQVLYCIDTAVQTHLDSCLVNEYRSDVDDECLDFAQDQAQILKRKFIVLLPECLQTTKRDLDDPSDSTYPAKKPRNADGKHDEEKKVKNMKPNQRWLLKRDENESFGKIFHHNIKSCPKQGDKFICLKFWIKGECNKGCRNLHEQIKEDTKNRFGKWVQACRDGDVAEKDF